ncbi:CHAP domain-containing protein [Acetobacter musti]|uniref:CHAP domain-containing protein n=1 Tax=Acetobacter musti TaxID=864732 RepID=A0ABX0JNE3_9PROT|nr:CHAP domain-containing protein [Acetobacter musti]NHN84021.1 CHAP domain-containing protein [Acetobacter musti]
MRLGGLGFKQLSLTAVAIASVFSAAKPSTASAHTRAHLHHRSGVRSIRFAAAHSNWHSYRPSSGHVIQCVAFAKAESDIALPGNARDWWSNAAGRYARGQAPESGSVLNFRPIRRMPLGHVAIVTGTLNSRVITIDQSHWGQNSISRNVRVVDVSPDNDWSAVRVELNGKTGTFGSIYPTYGFIYPRPEYGSQVMTADSPSAQQAAAQYAEAAPTAGTVENHYLATSFSDHHVRKTIHRRRR